MCVPKIAKSFTCFQRSHSKKQFGYRNFPCLHILHFSLWSSDERQPSCPPVSPPPPPSLNSVPLSFLWTKIISAPHTLDLFLELVWIAILRKANDWLIFLRGEQRRRLIWNFRILLRAIVRILKKKNVRKKHVLRNFPNVTSWGSCGDRGFFSSELHGPIQLTLIEQWPEIRQHRNQITNNKNRVKKSLTRKKIFIQSKNFIPIPPAPLSRPWGKSMAAAKKLKQLQL